MFRNAIDACMLLLAFAAVHSDVCISISILSVSMCGSGRGIRGHLSFLGETRLEAEIFRRARRGRCRRWANLLGWIRGPDFDFVAVRREV